MRYILSLVLASGLACAGATPVEAAPLAGTWVSLNDCGPFECVESSGRPRRRGASEVQLDTARGTYLLHLSAEGVVDKITAPGQPPAVVGDASQLRKTKERC
jgi:hypothetical protein